MIKFFHTIEDTYIKILMVAITALVFLEVVLRFIFNTGFLWVQELTLYLSAWMVLLGASWGIRHGVHIGVDIVVKNLEKSKQKKLSYLAFTLCLVYTGLFLYGSWVYLLKMKMIGIELEDLPIQKWLAMSCLMFGFILLSIRILSLAIAVYKDKRLGFSFIDEAKDSMQLADEVLKKNTNISRGKK